MLVEAKRQMCDPEVCESRKILLHKISTLTTALAASEAQAAAMRAALGEIAASGYHAERALLKAINALNEASKESK
jgi:hypothetical protein